MAVNEWLNGYLKAILDVGSSSMRSKQRNDGKLKMTKFEKYRDDQREETLFNPTKYFVEEVVNSFDESDLYRTWAKVPSYTYNSPLLSLSICVCVLCMYVFSS